MQFQRSVKNQQPNENKSTFLQSYTVERRTRHWQTNLLLYDLGPSQRNPVRTQTNF